MSTNDKKVFAPTPQQSDAIELSGGDILVSAAAGSGKTAVLVARVLRLLCDEQNKIDADKIVIVTFTNAAAAELKNRISKGIYQRLSQNRDSVWLKRQKLLLERANIGTLDSLCIKLVREHFSTLPVYSGSKIGDKASLAELYNEAMEETLNDALNEPKFVQLCDMYGKAKSHKGAQIIESISDSLDCRKSLDEAISHIIESYRVTANPSQNKYMSFMLLQAKKELQTAKKYCLLGKRIIENTIQLQNYYPAFCCDEIELNVLLQSIDKGDWDAARQKALRFVPEKLKSVNGDFAQKELVTALRNEIKDSIKSLATDFFFCDTAEFIADMSELKQLVSAALTAVKAYKEKLFSKKLGEGIFSFNDYEQMALSLLLQEGSVDFAAVFVDEYQDTNQLQDEIYKELAKNGDLFMVGDIKQSIYGFRDASPEIFIEKQQSFYSKQEKMFPAKLHLSVNFRSSAEVILAINDIFSSIMSRQLGGVDYIGEQPLAVPVGKEKNDSSKVFLHFVEKPPSGNDADFVAVRVAEILAQGVYSPHEIAIITRTKKHFKDYSIALSRLGIQSHCNAQDELLDTETLAPLLAILRIINNPTDEISLVAALLCPIFNFSPERLLEIRKSSGLNLYNALKQLKQPDAQGFLEFINALNNKSYTSSVSALVKSIIKQTDYMLYFAKDEQLNSRVNAFISLAKKYDTNSAKGLCGFIYYIDNAQRSGIDDANKGVSEPGKVSIMTVHKSKGLEFEVCIVADLSHKFNLRETYENVQLHKGMGLSANLSNEHRNLYPTIPLKAISMAKKADLLSEEMRIFYVALTRAKQQLILVACVENIDKSLKKTAALLEGEDVYLSSCSSYAQWLLYFALSNKNAYVLHEILGYCPTLRDSSGEITITYEAAGGVLASKEPIQEPTAEIEPEIIAAINKNISGLYHTAELCELPIKTSVSALVHTNHIGCSQLTHPKYQQEKKLTAAELGTVMHSFLQFADFSAARISLEQEIERLVKNRFIDAHMAAGIDRQTATAFLNTDLCQRIICSDKQLKEYAFITEIKASLVSSYENISENERIQLQGVIDLVIFTGETIEIIDFKTDKNKSKDYFVQTYQKQLELYKETLSRQLGKEITKTTIYSFYLNKEITP